MASAGIRPRVLVDMTPLEPGGQNGGAGLVATSLVHHLGALASDLDFTLLTSADSHPELASLEAPNVARMCVIGPRRARTPAGKLFDSVVPAPARVRLKHAYARLRTQGQYATATNSLQADLLLCPFTVPYFWREGLKCVSIVYDLQHLTYPAFFTPEQRFNRQRHLEQVASHADRVICISNYVRETLLAAVNMCAKRVETIHLGLLLDASAPDARVLDRLGLRGVPYLLYPANFWPHKNHARLFEALRLCANSPRLVLTGAPNAYLRSLDVPESVIYAGYLTPAELTALLDSAAALIFPSLYEGFGLPVLEAMSRGRPVLCSNVTSLPEVVGDAAILFEPRDVAQIGRAIDTVLNSPSTVADLVQRGYQRAGLFGDARRMAQCYLDVVREELADNSC